jgi:hypothetical protein
MTNTVAPPCSDAVGTPYSALVCSPHGDIQPLKCPPGMECSTEVVRQMLDAPMVEVIDLGGGVGIWRDPTAGFDGPAPEMNFGSMWLCMQLAGPMNVSVIFGRTMMTGLTKEGTPRPLRAAEVSRIRSIVYCNDGPALPV